MRNLKMSLLLIGMTNLGVAQYSPPETDNPLENNIYSISANVDYLDKVQGGSTPAYVRLVEQEVSNWDPTLSSKFGTKKYELFSTNFQTAKGYISAYYDHKGDILFATERFKNVALPYYVSRSIAIEYPGWSFDSTKYLVQYAEGKTAKRVFKVVIKKGNKTKRLKVHVPESN